jgi:septal ring factor EnvC (AmiA/AmiB activator)
MLPWWAVFLIAALAAIVAWLWAINSERHRNAGRLLELEARLRTLEHTDRELRSTLGQKDKELGELRETREAKAALQARLGDLEKRKSELDAELQRSQEELKTTNRDLAESREFAASLKWRMPKGHPKRRTSFSSRPLTYSRTSGRRA